MEAYTGFAYVYDEYMDNIPYDEWEEYLVELLKENGIDKDNTVIDLGCGTGTVTRMLEKEGYNCIGIDLSEDMLSIASDKTYDSGQQIIYSCQDMRDFEVPYETDAFISIGDSMNYITANDDLCDVFKCVKKGLKQGGVFDAVKKAGLKIRNVYDAFSHNAPDDNSERLYYIIEK